MPMKLLQKQEISGKNMQLLFLLAAGSVVFLFVVIECLMPGMGYFFAEKYLAVPSLLFFGAALTQRLPRRVNWTLWLSALAVLWFAAVQLHHHLIQMSTRAFGPFAVMYLLAFPFAAVTEDEEGTGMKWIGKIYVAASLMLVLFAGMLLLDAVPAALASGIYWDGARLSALWHPNVGACIFMIGIGFSLYFFFRADRKWVKGMMAVLAAAQFFAMALTNCRTSILMTCALIGGTVFFLIWKGSWKRFLMGAAAALVVMIALFALSGTLFDLHTEAQIAKLTAQLEEQEKQEAAQKATEAPEEASETEAAKKPTQKLKKNKKTGEVTIAGQSNQGTLTGDLKTLNGRTKIWKAAFTALRDNPSTRIWGTEYVGIEISTRNSFPVEHSHNSWVEVLMHLGIPGLLISLIYTAIALVSALVLLWRQDVAMGKKVVALTVLCVMVAGFLEPYLFITNITTIFADFLFFFCTGYLAQWSQAAVKR